MAISRPVQYPPKTFYRDECNALARRLSMMTEDIRREGLELAGEGSGLKFIAGVLQGMEGIQQQLHGLASMLADGVEGLRVGEKRVS